MQDSFWKAMDLLIQSAEVIIDRPKGSAHPRYPSVVYPLDYGYLAGTTAGDGNGVDVWRGSRAQAVLDAVVCTVDLQKRDVEIKLLLGCTEQEKATILQWHNSDRMAAILVRR